MLKSLFIFACVLALASATYYELHYTGYTDNTCSAVNDKVTGQIFAYTCAPESRKEKYTTGKIINVNATHLTSCDYSDMKCENQTICVVYANNACADSVSADFSNKYSWAAKQNGSGWDINYTSYTQDGCVDAHINRDMTGPIYEDKCAPEFTDIPQSGKITYIDDYTLTSCDYYDTNCAELKECVNYNNSVCYASEFTAFSNKYSWNATNNAATTAPSTSAPATAAPATQAPNSEPSTSAPSDSTNAPATQAPATNGDWQITYTGYTDNRCNKVDTAVTGQIFAYTCAPEYRLAPQSGKLTKINDKVVTSCDYSDDHCGTQKYCEDYSNGECYNSGDNVMFSNKYTWATSAAGDYLVIYTSYLSKDCSGNATVSSTITPQVCGKEFQTTPQSGKITAITADWLMSCDYSDTTCTNLILCENYTNHKCYGSEVAAFSNVYSWFLGSSTTPSSGGSSPTSLPISSGGGTATGIPSSSASTTAGGKSEDWDIAYIAFKDNACSEKNVDVDMTGQIFAYKCVAEFRSAPQSGKIVYINDEYLTSCDYSDANCTQQTVCENYKNNECANSNAEYSFSNKYSWTKNSNGAYVIIYTSFTSTDCYGPNADVQGEIFEGFCAREDRKSQSGMITYIDENTLTSCDYSDAKCQNLILCESYSNTKCYGSPVTSFSNIYAWKRHHSSASAVSAVVSFGVACVAALLVLF